MKYSKVEREEQDTEELTTKSRRERSAGLVIALGKPSLVKSTFHIPESKRKACTTGEQSAEAEEWLLGFSQNHLEALSHDLVEQFKPVLSKQPIFSFLAVFF